MSTRRNHRETIKANISIFVSILSFILSFSVFIYNIYKDNKESVSLVNLEYNCMPNSNEDYYTISGSYLIINNSYKKISIIDAYVTYDGTRITSSLDDLHIFPIILDSNESYIVPIGPEYASYYLEPSLFKINIITSKQKTYSIGSTLFPKF